MKKMFCLPFVFAAAIVPSHVFAATPPTNFEVLGIEVAEDRPAAEGTLKKLGYSSGREVIGCNRSHAQIVRDYVSTYNRDVMPGALTCVVSYSKGESSVKIHYLIAPERQVVNEVEYSFRSGETYQQVLSRLQGKFGLGSPSAVIGLQLHEWKSSLPDRGPETLKYNGGSAHNVSLSGGLEDTFREETRKMIARQLANKKPGDL